MGVFLMVLVGFVAWALPTAAGIWYLITVREMQQDIRVIRRYMQDLHVQSTGGRMRG